MTDSYFWSTTYYYILKNKSKVANSIQQMVNFNVSAFNLFPLFMNLRRPQDKKANFCLPLTNNVAECTLLILQT